MTSTSKEKDVSPWDFYSATEDRKARRNLATFGKYNEKELVEFNKRYAIMNTNGGYVTVTGVVLPKSIDNDNDAIAIVNLIKNSYSSGHDDGVEENQKALIDVLGLKKHIKHM